MTSLSIYNVGHQKCEPGYQWGPGIRNHYCIHHIISGSGYYTVNDKTYHLFAGDTFILYPDTEVKYYADIQEPWEYAWVAFSGTEAERLVSEYRREEAGYCYRFDRGNEWREIIMALVAAFSGTSHNMDEMRGYLYLLFSHFPGNAVQSDLFEKNYIEQAETYIRHNYSYPIQISDVARFVGIDRTYLYRIFMMHKGVSPKHYLTEYRVLEAKRLLEDTSLSITETALSCGFHDASVFCRYFQKAEGESPLQYRRQFHKADS